MSNCQCKFNFSLKIDLSTETLLGFTEKSVNGLYHGMTISTQTNSVNYFSNYYINIFTANYWTRVGEISKMQTTIAFSC